jgi:hypothetical protein
MRPRARIEESTGRRWLSFDGKWWFEVFEWDDVKPKQDIDDIDELRDFKEGRGKYV